MKTALITGCSSGYGLETARHFHAQGWNVVATMRTPREDVLPRSERLRVLALDVTKPESIRPHSRRVGPSTCWSTTRASGSLSAFEVTPMTTVHEVFETNTFGVMAMTQAVLPQFRARTLGRRGERDLERDAGADAAGGRVHRQQDGHRRVHRVARVRARGLQGAREAGRAGLLAPARASQSNGAPRMQGLLPEAYAPFAQQVFASFGQPAAVTKVTDVAEAVWRAANDESGQLRFPAGADAVALARAA
jgi:NAD(P)-dependent dehydrogenase (short-subunit alcohol dehydrogenase family)